MLVTSTRSRRYEAMSELEITITVGGEPATIDTLDTFSRGIEALIRENDAAFDYLDDLSNATIPNATRDAFVAEHDRLRRISNSIFEAKGRVANRAAFGVKA